ncbi:CLUMA_CG010264, isoform A [Clunio marinus]|uniref:CLUMA_CG010264, isoform A n=1 Tax=Clunio marinus TaxID=568069 RepID=A0A1J1ICS2_9DIPT|nr:CLUMA_CG010264, isoform A [Clunio marinus]
MNLDGKDVARNQCLGGENFSARLCYGMWNEGGKSNPQDHYHSTTQRRSPLKQNVCAVYTRMNSSN